MDESIISKAAQDAFLSFDGGVKPDDCPVFTTSSDWAKQIGGAIAAALAAYDAEKEATH